MSDNDVPPKNNQVEYLNPAVGDLLIAEQDLRKVSDQLHALWGASDMVQVEDCDFSAWFVLPGDIVARVPDGTLGPESGVNIRCESGQYIAEACGYLSLRKNTLSVVPPIWTDSDFVRAYWLVLQKDVRQLSVELIQKTLSDFGIARGVIDGAIGLVALWVSEDASQFKKSMVAEGIVPDRGEDAHLEIVVGLIEQTGVEQDDGTLKFSDEEPDCCIKRGTVVGRLHLAKTGGADGEDLKGDLVAAHRGKDLKVVAGDGISINRASDDIWEYIAGKDGVLRNDHNKLSIVELLTVQGDVGYQTGNVDFDGDVFVKGSISSRFSVKATGSVIIVGSVRPSATVMAQGDIIVGEGVSGEKTRLMAIGMVRAQFVQGAHVQSGKQIFLGSYAYKAFLRAGNIIKINKTDGAKGGSIIGGDTWSSLGLDIPIAGALTKVHTRLHVGISPTQAERLNEIQQKLEAGQKVIKQCLIKFQVKQIDLDKVKTILAAATGSQKAMLTVVARQLGKVMKLYRTLLKERLSVTQSLGVNNKKSHVVVREKVFPGVLLQIGNVQQEIVVEMDAAVYRVRGDKIIDERLET